jgi:L,D-transpeptidase ErfK/SrfK
MDGTLFLEVHPPLAEDREKYGDFMQVVQDAISDTISGVSTKYRVALSARAIRTAIEEQTGIPVAISR